MKHLIVTADDLGWSESTNVAVAAAATAGVVTRASVMGNGPALEDAARRFATLAPVGVHLNLTELSACAGTPVAGAADDAGRFRGVGAVLAACARGAVDREAVRREWDEQIGRVQAAGFRPAHLDGHHHVHVFPGLFPLALELARRHGIPAVRVPSESPLLPHPGARSKRALLHLLARGARQASRARGIAVADHFRGLSLFAREADHHRRLLELLEALPAGLTELMVHPREGRAGAAESASLAHPATRDALQRLAIGLARSEMERTSPS